MLTPIKTLIKNLSSNPIRIRVTNRLTLCMGAAGTDMHSAELAGELFSMLDNDRSSMAVLDMIRTGLIELTYIIDPVFVTKAADTNFMNIPYGATRDWYLNASAKPETKKEAPAATKRKEEPKQEEKKVEEPRKVEEPKKGADKPLEEPKAADKPTASEDLAKPVEPVVEQPKQPKQVEEPKQEEKKVEEPKKETPKAGRRIKVQ